MRGAPFPIPAITIRALRRRHQPQAQRNKVEELSMKALSHRNGMALALLLGSLLAGTSALAQDCKSGPVTVGLLPKLDTDPYFQVAKTGAEEAQGEIGGKVVQQAPSQATAEAQI